MPSPARLVPLATLALAACSAPVESNPDPGPAPFPDRVVVTADWLNRSLTIFDHAGLVAGATVEEARWGTVDLAEYAPGPLELELTPEEAGLSRRPLAEIEGGSPESNLELLVTSLEGRGPPACLDAVALNAGTLTRVTGRAPTLARGVSMAREALPRPRPPPAKPSIHRLSKPYLFSSTRTGQANRRRALAGSSGFHQYMTVASRKPASVSQKAGALKPCSAYATGPCQTSAPTCMTVSRAAETSMAPRKNGSCL